MKRVENNQKNDQEKHRKKTKNMKHVDFVLENSQRGLFGHNQSFQIKKTANAVPF